jgi:hypothetical protein
MGIAAIEEMVASQKGVDWVMVELTGVADPGQPTLMYVMALKLTRQDQLQRASGRMKRWVI